MNLSQTHTGTVNINVVHSLDPKQFAVLSAFLTSLVSILGEATPEQIQALTAKLKASGDALQTVVQQTTPQP